MFRLKAEEEQRRIQEEAEEDAILQLDNALKVRKHTVLHCCVLTFPRVP